MADQRLDDDQEDLRNNTTEVVIQLGSNDQQQHLFSSSSRGIGACQTPEENEADRFIMQMTSVESIDRLTENADAPLSQNRTHLTMPLGESGQFVRGRVSPIQIREDDTLMEQTDIYTSQASKVPPIVLYPKAASTLAAHSNKSA